MIRNYFSDLELSAEANIDDVRKAYRKLVRKFHPDLNPMDPYAEQSFSRIQEAYDYLNSMSRIAKLKKVLEPQIKGNSRMVTRWGEASVLPRNSAEFIADWKEERTSYSKKKFVRPKEDLDIHLAIHVPWTQSNPQPLAVFEYKFQRPCPYCRGVGGPSRSVKSTCKSCAGIGFNMIERGALHWKKTCDGCAGKGFVISTPCETCSGRGKISEAQNVKIKLSKKADMSREFLLKEFGHYSFDGKERGDLWVKIVPKR